jgi:hypothetical protein
MSDVRDELIRVMSSVDAFHGLAARADAILERFDVTPKPVIYPSHLGMIVAESHSHGAPDFEAQGKRMLGALESRGLKIVRAEE